MGKNITTHKPFTQPERRDPKSNSNAYPISSLENTQERWKKLSAKEL